MPVWKSLSVKELNEIPYNELEQYHFKILNCSGLNYSFLGGRLINLDGVPKFQIRGKDQNIHWCMNGNAFIYYYVISNKQPSKYEAYFYDFINQIKYKLADRKFESIIWRM